MVLVVMKESHGQVVLGEMGWRDFRYVTGTGLRHSRVITRTKTRNEYSYISQKYQMPKAYSEYEKYYHFIYCSPHEGHIHHSGYELPHTPCKNQTSEHIIRNYQPNKQKTQRQDHLLKGARSTDATNDCLRSTNVHVFDVSRHTEDDGTVNTVEGAGDVAGVCDLDVADGLGDIGERPLLDAGDRDGPGMFCGVDESDCYIGSLTG